MRQIDIAITNLMETPDLQPIETREIFKMIEKLRSSSIQINSSLEQTRSTLGKLNEEHLKVIGSFDACLEILAKMLPEELVKEQGMELNAKKSN